MPSEENSTDESTPPLKISIIAAVLISCLGSTFVYGYCISVMNSPRQKIECFFLETWLSDFAVKNLTINRKKFMSNCVRSVISEMLSPMDDVLLRWMYTMTQVVWVVFVAIGSSLTGTVADRLGRRTGLALANLFSVLAALLILPILYVKSPTFIYVTRALSGFHNGLVIPLQSMYVTEIVPIRLRGAIGSSGQLSITIGIFIGGLVGLEQALNREGYWVVAIALSGLPSLASSIVLFLLPESPRFLYINRGDVDAAREAVQRFCDPIEIDKTMESLKAEKEQMEKQEAAEKFSLCTLISSRRYRMAMILALVLVAVQQLSGINVVMQYSSIMLESTGISKTNVPFVIIVLYGVNVLATVAALPLLEKLGRRTLVLISLLIVSIGLIWLLVVCVSMSNSSDAGTRKLLSGIACGIIFIYVIGFAIGLGCVPVMYLSEIFQQKSRGAANSLIICIQQICCVLVVLTYYNAEQGMGHFVYLLYVLPVTIGMVFFYFNMPETKGRSVDEIADELSARMGGPTSQ